MVNKIDCICQMLYEIKGFSSLNGFQRFKEYIKNLVDEGDLIPIPVTNRYADFSEEWYKCKSCEQVWKLVYPDFPFKGLWTKVS